MRFENSTVLFLLFLPLLAAAVQLFAIWSRRRALNSFGNLATLNSQLLRPSPYLRAAKGIALTSALIGLVIAAARPQYGGRIRMLKKSGVDLVVALDFSKSMLAKDIKPSRIERAKLELAEFINQLTGDRIGLVAFAGDTMRFPLTSDYAAAVSFWKDLGPYDMPVGGTAIGKAITAAHRMLVPEEDGAGMVPENSDLSARSKAIILLTDGEDHFGDPVEAATEASKNGIRIYTVGIGSDSPELIPRYLDDGTVMGYQRTEDGEYVTTALSKENEDTLREIAALSSGRYFKAGDDLRGMSEVVKEIRKMKQANIESRQQKIYEDVFQWFLIPSFVLLILAFITPDRFRGRKMFSKGVVSAAFFGIMTLCFSPTAAHADSKLFMSENGDVKAGNKLLKEGKAGEAVKSYEKAARALPNVAGVHLNRGLAIMRMDENQIDQAMQAFRTAADAEGNDAVRARAHFNLGNTFFKKEDYAEAMKEYKKSLILSPGNKDVAWNLELAKQKKKEKEEQQKQDEQNKDEQNKDEQNKDEQNKDEQNKDEQNKDEQNKDEQNKDEQKKDEQKEEQKKQDEQKQDEQKQDEPAPQPKTKQEMEQLLNSLDNQEDNLQKQMAKRRAGASGAPRKDW